jgi:preprotein translocase subunit SecA
MTKTEKKEAIEKLQKEVEAVEKRLLEMDKEELQNKLQRFELKYSKIKEERDILKQVVQDIRKATENLVSLSNLDKQKAFLKILPEDEL